MSLLLRAYLLPKTSFSEEACLFRLIMSFRSYALPYDEIRAGYMPMGNDSVYIDRALNCAILSGCNSLIQFYIDQGADDWFTAARFAIRARNEALIWMFIDKYYRKDGTGNLSALMYDIAKSGNIQLLEMFISKGWIDWNDGLEGAAAGGHKNLIEFFIKKGANHFHEASFLAIQYGHISLIEGSLLKCELLCLKAKLLAATVGGQIALVNSYFSQGANNIDECMTFAVLRRKPQSVDQLIRLGANMEKGIQMAAAKGFKSFVTDFLKRGADVNVAMLAAVQARKLSMVQFLMDRGANNWAQALESLRPRKTEQQQGRQIIAILISRLECLDLRHTQTGNYCPVAYEPTDINERLHIAAKIDNEALAIHFMNQGATDVNAALLHAITGNCVSMVAFLLKHDPTNLVQALKRGRLLYFIDRNIIEMLKSAITKL